MKKFNYNFYFYFILYKFFFSPHNFLFFILYIFIFIYIYFKAFDHIHSNKCKWADEFLIEIPFVDDFVEYNPKLNKKKNEEFTCCCKNEVHSERMKFKFFFCEDEDQELILFYFKEEGRIYK